MLKVTLRWFRSMFRSWLMSTVTKWNLIGKSYQKVVLYTFTYCPGVIISTGRSQEMQWNRANNCLWQSEKDSEAYFHTTTIIMHHIEFIRIVTDATFQQHTQRWKCVANAFPACNLYLLCIMNLALSATTYVLTNMCRELRCIRVQYVWL